MNSGPLPPVPDLIPISALRNNKGNNSSCCSCSSSGSSSSSSSRNNNNNGKRRDCAPYSTTYNSSEVMGEQRSRRTGKQPAIDLIDTVQSRGSSAAPQAPTPSRKARSERHRKSDRRRDYKGGRRRSDSKQRSRSRASSPETPANPRVNPIFVWVRQEDTHIVDVKCEDYDRRNRILLTKTAQGWRAIPRTETWTPSLREAADDRHPHNHRFRKSRKSKVKRKSTAVQVDESVGTEDDLQIAECDEHEKPGDSPVWTAPVNIESHLPSHKIQVLKERSPSRSPEPIAEEPNLSVNSDVNYSAQARGVKCNASKICDVSPLDNLLAVAELEFNHQIETGEWSKTTDSDTAENTDNSSVIKQYEEDDINDEHKEYLDNFEQLNKLIESCSNNDNSDDQEHFAVQKSEDCDYNEEDDNNLAMDDILNRLEQSLRSPETCKDINEILNQCENSLEAKLENSLENINENNSDVCNLNNNNNFNDVPELDAYLDNKDDMIDEKADEAVELSSISSINQDTPTDLSVKSTGYVITTTTNSCDNMEPTDLSIPKSRKSPSRPASQNSETIQSPQPSGIPAVPPSPDLINANMNRSKTTTLDSLLMSRDKIALNSEVTITRQKEPLDLGKCRKSASPTVTCSEEAKNDVCSSDAEPASKKFKFEDAHIKSLMDAQSVKTKAVEKKRQHEAQSMPETPKLLELLTSSDSETDPLSQLKQVLADPVLNVPDPMLIPKDKLSVILSSPGKEIPKLLKQRPELRLPEALAFPHLLQDPNILVITLAQLQTIIQKQSQPLPLKDLSRSEEGHQGGKAAEKIDERPKQTAKATTFANEEHNKQPGHTKEAQNKNSCINELANDIDAATNTALNQMMWLPYLNQLEAAMSFNNNAEILKMLSSAFPLYPGQMPPDMTHLFGNARIPPPVNLPVQPQNYNNPLEFSMWQEAMMQANLLRSKNAYDTYNSKNTYRDYVEKMSSAPSRKMSHNMKHHQSVKPNAFYPASNMHPYQVHNPFMNIPNNYQSPPTSSKHNLHIPQYNPMLPQKSLSKTVSQKTQNLHQRSSNSANAQYHQRADERRQTQQQQARLEQSNNSQKPKVTCKSFANVAFQRGEEVAKNFGPDYPRPMDLSDPSVGSRYKMRQHYMEQPVNTQKFFKPDEVPEVGSTTASIEEMQDAQKHLWHPLFGNQKNYNNPWNWSPVTATGE